MNDGSNRPGPKPGVYGRTKLERFDQSSAPDANRSGKTRGRTLTMAELRDRADESSVASAPFASHFHPSKVRSLPGQAEPASAIILSAGRGSRLLPLTESLPKCLLSVGGRSVVEWQLGALAAAGIPRATVVIGFGADKVRNVLASRFPSRQVRTLFNPRFATADNLISCWMARGSMRGDFFLINGDTLFEPEVPRRLLASDPWPVTIAVVRKRVYDEDDMKVQCEGTWLRQIGKGLAPHETDAEAIGMILFRGDGPRLFREALDRAAATSQATKQFYLSVINDMAGEGLVRTLSVDGLEWTEIDFLPDLERAEGLVAGWQAESQPSLATTA